MMTLILHLEILVAVETEMVLEVGLELGVDLMVMEGGGDLVVMEEVTVVAPLDRLEMEVAMAWALKGPQDQLVSVEDPGMGDGARVDQEDQEVQEVQQEV